jgi:hypothetical protein
MLYKVVSHMLEQELIVEAKNATQAKRKACRLWGIIPSDEWHGISTMQARKLTKEEEKQELQKWGIEDASI